MDGTGRFGETSAGLTKRFQALPGNLRGAAWIIVATVLFTIMMTLIKLIGTRLPVAEILVVRQSVMFLAALPLIIRGFPASLTTRRPLLHAGRILFAVIAMFCGFTAVVHLPLADATAIAFAKSFFIPLFAIVILKEAVGPRRWGAIIVGFIGVMVMLNPTGAGIDGYGLLAVAGAASAALVMVIIRLLSRSDLAITILAYQTVFVGVLLTPLAIWQWVWPSWTEFGLLVAIGLVSVTAQSCNIQAFRAGEATVLAALDYARLLWATILGILIFSEVPAMRTFIGAGIVIAAALYTIHREARRGQRLARSPAGRGYTN
ncbi:drug/metabolite transporter (DMT)-like permease [Rhodopseudomonas julia]|uniref:Drug/metabolite transporter (DMT)-like permease n=1 Tax=Rhodopseudomonas julia TaxID=200617 RepID=A0ABU0C8G1_9BRAD|nr:DMT family transporter [Rhodopseudomonas julia]MDQ0326764.1 drug/metabolite transporter (DMT)-like permease [Rhodopseudomonas julia]